MSGYARCFAILIALACTACGRIGVELVGSAPQDGGSEDAEVGMADAKVGPGDAAQELDGSRAADGSGTDGSRTDGSATDGSALVDGNVETSSDASVADASGSDAQAGGTLCNLTGTFAVKLAIGVSWPAGLIQSGSGTSNIWARWTVTQSADQLTGTWQPCGFDLPPFSLSPAVANEPYQLLVPSTLFDHVPAYLPATAVSATSASAFKLGQPITLPSFALQVGVALANPMTDAWPSAATLAGMNVDMDGDGKAGVTSNYNNMSPYLYPRADALVVGGQRSDRAYTAVRFGLSASLSLTSCTDLLGNASFSNFDTHIMGCRISGGGDCSTMQRDTIDSGRPGYSVDSATFHAVKVAASATCTDVRNTLK